MLEAEQINLRLVVGSTCLESPYCYRLTGPKGTSTQRNLLSGSLVDPASGTAFGAAAAAQAPRSGGAGAGSAPRDNSRVAGRRPERAAQKALHAAAHLAAGGR